MCGFIHFLCQVELGLFSSVLCWAGLRYQSSVVVLASVGLWFLCWCCCWFMVDLWWSLSGHRALSAFPRLSGATPGLWQCRCPWGVLISCASMGAPYADLLGSRHMETVGQRGISNIQYYYELKPCFTVISLLYIRSPAKVNRNIWHLHLKFNPDKKHIAFSSTLFSHFQQEHNNSTIQSDPRVSLWLHIQSKWVYEE